MTGVLDSARISPLVQVAHPENGGHMAVISLNRPSALNALSTDLARGLTDAFNWVRETAAIRSVVLTSTTSTFCVGADLKERHGVPLEQLELLRTRASTVFTTLGSLEIPTIAAVEGKALGGGLELALSCDIVVAGDDAVLGLPEVRVGMVPGAGGTQMLPRRVGWSQAALMIFTGSPISAPEAQKHGLVDVLVPAGDALSRALELGQQIASNSPVAVRQAKRAMLIGRETDRVSARQAEDQCWRVSAMSSDRREGIAAFVQKRAPRWQDS